MGTVYGGRWETRRTIGKGGQSEVFEAIDTHTPAAEPVALKRITNPKRLNWFFDEVEAIARVDHPNIIKLIEFSVFENTAEKLRQAYIVMPRAWGGDLSMRVTRYKGDVDGTLTVARQIAMGLVAAHKAGVLHRDVKPQNILFTDAGNDVWLTDFGVCLLKDPKEAAGERGTSGLAAPEHWSTLDLQATESDDIHSLGTVIYYMLTGGRTVPRDAEAELAEAPRSSYEDYSRMILFLLGKMVCARDARLRTMAEVIQGLDQIKN